MPTKKEETSKKKTVYKKETPNTGTPYKAPDVHEDLFGMQTTAVAREGFHIYWARESEVRIRAQEGYEVADPTHYPHLGLRNFQTSDDRKTSVIRLPSQDSNEDLVLMEVPLELYKQKKAKEAAIAKTREDAIKGKNRTNPHAGVTMDTEGKHSISNK